MIIRDYVGQPMLLVILKRKINPNVVSRLLSQQLQNYSTQTLNYN